MKKLERFRPVHWWPIQIKEVTQHRESEHYFMGPFGGGIKVALGVEVFPSFILIMVVRRSFRLTWGDSFLH